MTQALKGLGLKRINFVRMGMVVGIWLLGALGLATHASMSDRASVNETYLATETSRLPFATRFSIDHHDLMNFQVSVYNLAGISVFQSQQTEKSSLRWNMLGLNGNRVPNGVYLYAVDALMGDGRTIRTDLKKLVILH